MVASELIDILVPAFLPCAGFKTACSQANWNPLCGNVLRGFVGASGDLKEVEIILVIAEPGNPQRDEVYYENEKPRELLARTTQYVYECYDSKRDEFHRNVRYFLDCVYPTLDFCQQMRRVWITESYLCSAKKECGPIKANAERECSRRYLEPELRLFPERPIVAFGLKAQKRINNGGSTDLNNKNYKGVEPVPTRI